MFRREAYDNVGGYRVQFSVAQDLDLWMRLSEVGECRATPEVLCERHLSKNSISAIRRAEQLSATKLLVRCAAARRSGQDDSHLLAKFIRQKRWHELFCWSPQKLQEARFYYFIGSLLRQREPEKAELYFWRAVGAWFAFPKAWWRILGTPWPK
jgi:hypothetical protein